MMVLEVHARKSGDTKFLEVPQDKEPVVQAMDSANCGCAHKAFEFQWRYGEVLGMMNGWNALTTSVPSDAKIIKMEI